MDQARREPAIEVAARPERARGSRGLRLGSFVAVALAAAFATWLVVDRTAGDSPSPAALKAAEAPTQRASAPAVIRPRVVALSQLAQVAGAARAPLYWAGPRAGSSFELTRTASGTVYLRYLPAGRVAGDRKAALTIVTYPIANALATVRAAAREPGAVRVDLPGGGLAVVERSRPTNIHFAYPAQDAQVEVYAPEPGAARRLVVSGAVRPFS